MADDDHAPDDPAHPPLAAPPSGLVARRPVDGDLPAIAGLYDAVAVRSRHGTTGRGALRGEADLRRTWSGRRDDALLVESTGDGRLVGYLEFHEDVDPWTPALDLYVEARVAPRADAATVSEFLLRRTLDRARRAASRHPDLPVALRTTLVDPRPATRRWFADHGFVAERHQLRLRIDLDVGTPTPTWPHGMRGVRADRLPDERVHAALVASFADHHLGATDDLHDWRAVALRTGRVDLRTSLAAVAADEEVVGVALCRRAGDRDPGSATIADLGVHPGWRGRGIATALLRGAFALLAAHGATRVGLDVDDVTLDGALRLYRRAGMEVVHHAVVLRLTREATPGPAPPGS